MNSLKIYRNKLVFLLKTKPAYLSIDHSQIKFLRQILQFVVPDEDPGVDNPRPGIETPTCALLLAYFARQVLPLVADVPRGGH